MIALRRVSRHFGAMAAVEDLSLEVAAGEVFSLLGPSGCGKTATLLSFSLSFDDYVVSSFTAGETLTLPLYLAGAFQREISPQIQVLSTLVLLVSGLILLLASQPQRGRSG